jgi:hypothetical protein
MKQFALLAVLALTACASAPPKIDHTYAPHQMTAAETKSFEAGLRNSMKDPDSTRIGNVYASRSASTNTIAICGYVNAKNSYGGYSGDKPFVGAMVGDTFILQLVDNSEFGVKLIRDQCRERQVPITL